MKSAPRILVGAFALLIAAGIIVGLVDTLGRTFLPMLIRAFADREVANAAGPALASMLIYVLMAVILVMVFTYIRRAGTEDLV